MWLSLHTMQLHNQLPFENTDLDVVQRRSMHVVCCSAKLCVMFSFQCSVGCEINYCCANHFTNYNFPKYNKDFLKTCSTSNGLMIQFRVSLSKTCRFVDTFCCSMGFRETDTILASPTPNHFLRQFDSLHSALHWTQFVTVKTNRFRIGHVRKQLLQNLKHHPFIQTDVQKRKILH